MYVESILKTLVTVGIHHGVVASVNLNFDPVLIKIISTGIRKFSTGGTTYS